MRVLPTSLVLFTFLVYGCRGSNTPDTPDPTTKGNRSPETDESNTLPKPTGRVAELVESLQSTDRQVAFDAATELGEMRSDALAAIPALVDLATFDEKGSHRVHPTLAAGEAIPKIDTEAAVPYLTESLKLPNKRYWAARILGEFGRSAKPAISALVDALRAVTSAQTEDERDGSAQAAAALAKIGPHGLSALISEMGHNDKEVRKLAVWATPRGANGKPAVNVLAQRLSDGDSDIRSLAANALADIGPDATDALPFIKIALDKERSGFTVFALQRALASINKNSNGKQ